MSRVSEAVSMLADEMFPLYLVHGENTTLVDAAVLSHAATIIRQLDKLLAGVPLRQVALTHSHYDHVGALAALQNKYGCSALASLRTKEILESPKAIAFIDHLNQEFKRMVGDDSPSTCTMPVSLSGVVAGERIPISPTRFLEAVETPGHTRCSISFLLLPERILFVGDAAGVMERDGRIKPLFLSNYRQYENSLQKVRELRPEILAMPHNLPIRGEKRVREFLTRSLAETERARDEILAALRQSHDFSEIAVTILAREYPNPTLLGPREAFLINLTAMVKAVYAEFAAPTK